MILWFKRIAALFCALVFAILCFLPGSKSLTAALAISNLIWAMSERMPRSTARFFQPAMLIANTIFSAYLAVKGMPPVWPILIATSSLVAWNSGLFLTRWGNAPLNVQRRYLRRMGAVIGLILGAEISSSVLRGHLSFGFFGVLSLTLVAVILLLRLISRALAKP